MTKRFNGNDLKDVWFRGIGRTFEEAKLHQSGFGVEKNSENALKWFKEMEDACHDPKIKEDDKLYVWNHPNDNCEVVYDWIYAKK